MKRFPLGLLLAALWLPASAAAQASSAGPAPTAHPMLWRIVGPTPSHLYGTVHLPDPRLTALPEAVTDALDASDVFCSEVRLDADTQARLAGAVVLPGETTLRRLLPPELYRRTGDYLAQRELEIAAFDRMKVWSLASVLSLLEHLDAMARLPALDAVLHQRAAAAGKRLDALETAEDQIALLDSLPLDGQIAMLRQTLDYLEAIEPGEPSPVERMIRVYLTGDAERLMQVSLEYADLSDPLSAEFFDALIDRRNLGMAAGIERRVRAHPDTGYFFAVGALHMPGPEGIVALLEKRGFEVVRVVP